MEKFGIGKASGKIILIGEHAVVYGQPAIAVPFLATKVIAYATEHPVDTLESLYYDGPLVYAPDTLKNIIIAFQLSKKATNLKENIKIKIESSIPPERGMGSSAAVANAVIRSIFDYQKLPLSHEQLKKLADEAEKIAHGNPSGIDQAATSGRHPLYFIKGQPLQAFPLQTKGFLIVADSKLKGRTREAVADLKKLLEKDPTLMSQVERLGQLSDEMKIALSQNQLHQVGKIMNESHQLLQLLTISNPLLDSMIALGRENGALGGKLTGGGRGGCVIFVTETIEKAKNIYQSLTQAGYPTWIQDLEELK